jgi:hypothetical protein
MKNQWLADEIAALSDSAQSLAYLSFVVYAIAAVSDATAAWWVCLVVSASALGTKAAEGVCRVVRRVWR